MGLGYGGGGVNAIMARQIYPAARGVTAGAQASAASSPEAATAPATGEGASSRAQAAAMANPAAQALAVGMQASPVRGLVLFAVMLVALAIITHKSASATAIKGTFFNVVFITLTAAVGLPALKALASTVKVPGVSNYVAAI